VTSFPVCHAPSGRKPLPVTISKSIKTSKTRKREEIDSNSKEIKNQRSRIASTRRRHLTAIFARGLFSYHEKVLIT
jgi:hypothetical protein